MSRVPNIRLEKGTRVRLIGDAWADLRNCMATVTTAGIYQETDPYDPTTVARAIVDPITPFIRDNYKDYEWYLWNDYFVDVIGFGECWKCHQPILDEIHYLCIDCRLP